MRVCCVFFGVLFSSLLAGCGGTQELQVTGTVKLNNAACADARVLFIPFGQTKGHGGDGITDADGKFVISNKTQRGLAPGTYRVVVSRLLKPDGTVLVPEVPPIESDAKESLPDIFSDPRMTTLSATVMHPQTSFDFDLKTKK